MGTSQNPISVCRYCQSYTPEGRRGGHCQQLHVPVQSGWKACPLALAPFAPSWETIEDIINLQQRTPLLQDVIPLEPVRIDWPAQKRNRTSDTEAFGVLLA